MKYFEKQAKLTVSDVEDEIGTYFDDKTEGSVRKAIALKKSQSFSMRHPILTGIPTLGIAPALANANAKEDIVRAMARGNASIRNTLIRTKQKRRDEDLAYYKANGNARAANNLSKGMTAAAAIMHNHNQTQGPNKKTRPTGW